jgi:hypothetical protein
MFVPRALAKVGLLVNGAVLLVFLAVVNFSSILPEGAVAFEGAAPVGATLEVTETGLKLVSSGFLAAPGRLIAPLRNASFWTLMLVSTLIYVLLLVNKREE